MYSFGYFPGIRLWFTDVSEPSIGSIFKGILSSSSYQGPGRMPQMHRSLIDLLCYPSNVQSVPTFAASPHPRSCYPRDPWQQRTELLRGRETWPTILPKCTSSMEHLGIFYMPLDMGPTTLLPLRRKAC